LCNGCGKGGSELKRILVRHPNILGTGTKWFKAYNGFNKVQHWYDGKFYTFYTDKAVEAPVQLMVNTSTIYEVDAPTKEETVVVEKQADKSTFTKKEGGMKNDN
jgi:hypothetical protein